jgi:transglutaminase-like putative cysteine protease
VAAAVRGGLLAAGAAAVAWPLGRWAGALAAAVGAVAGVLTGEWAATTRLRTSAALALAVLATLLGVALAALATTAIAATVLTPVGAVSASDLVLWGSVAAAATFALRCAAARYPALVALEVAILALALTTNLVAHRYGMVHRPLMVGDWAWSHGINPVSLLLLLGGAGSVALAFCLMTAERAHRYVWALSPIVLMALILGILVHVVGSPLAAGGDSLGLAGGPRDRGSSSGGGAGRAGGDGRSDDLMDFNDQYSADRAQMPAAVVIFDRDYVPSTGVYYFRQMAFSQFNGRRLVQSTVGNVDENLIREFPSVRVELSGAPPPADDRRAIETTIALIADNTSPFALAEPAAAWPAANPDPERFRRAYGVRSHVLTTAYEKLLERRTAGKELPAVSRRYYTEAPKDPRYAAVAAEALALLNADVRERPLAQALAIKKLLEQTGTYSLQSQHADAADPTGSFLFGDRTGYCVHFAHAAAFLLRTIGIPARIGAGYAVPAERRGRGSALLITAGDAHAWPEIYLDGVGWVVLDIAPEQSLDPPQPEPDRTLQQMLGEMARTSTDAPLVSPPRLSRPLVGWRDVARGAAALLVLALVGAYTVKVYRALAPRLRRSQLYRIGYRGAADRLAAVGYWRGRAESRERFAARAAAVAPSFGMLTWAHLGPPLGSAVASDAPTIRGLMAAVAREVRVNVPLWRRAVGLVNPVSWWATR